MLEAVLPSQASGMVVLTKAYVSKAYLVMQDPRKQAVVGTQVDTGWYWLVTVTGLNVVLPVACGQGVTVARGSARAAPAIKAAAPKEKRILKECNE